MRKNLNGKGMSSAILHSPTDLNEPVDPKDRFAYGWRYVKTAGRNGAEKTVQVPLTLEDILHPQEEDFRVLSQPHWQDAMYLYGVFKAALAKKTGAYVLGDCRVAWDRQGKYAHGPDIAVVFNVRAHQDWATFNVVKEKTKPALIVEVTSPSTRSTDLVNKVREYAEQGVPHYVIADAVERDDFRILTLLDYHLSPEIKGYYSMPLDEQGRIRLPEVKLWLGTEEGRLACYDKKGNRKGTYAEVEQARVEAEAKNKELAERLKAMEKEVHRLRGEKDKLNGS
jgi:colicin import membrane protein